MIRLDKYLADAGIGTRSEVKAYCKKGLVTVDSAVCRDADRKIDPGGMEIAFRGNTVTARNSECVCYMLNKPDGYLCATADSHADTVFALLPDLDPRRFFPVGRLDKDSEGLLLITNDGGLLHRLTSPRRHVPKTYEVWITGTLSENERRLLESGIDIGDGKPALPAMIEVLQTKQDYRLSDREQKRLPSGIFPVIRASRVRITVREGRYHQVKRMFHAIRHEVFYLKRISIGNLTLDPALESGGYRRLSAEEIAKAGETRYNTNSPGGS